MLNWTCYVCFNRIRDEEGSVFVRFSDVHRVEEEVKEWRKTHPDRGGQEFAEFTGNLDLVPWQAAHFECIPDDGESEGYWSDVSRLREYRQVLAFVCHMADKPWTKYTNLLHWARSVSGEWAY